MDPRNIPLMLALAVSLGSWPARAAYPTDTCGAAKLRAAGIYAACRLKADAKARLKDKDADYVLCLERFAKNIQKAEGAAGPGLCPTEGDEALIESMVTGWSDELAKLLAGTDTCPQGDRHREPGEVVADLRAALAAQDWSAVACSYSEDAFVIDDQGVLVGRVEIAAAHMSLAALFGDAQAEVTDETHFGDMVRTLFTLDAGWVTIPDGVHTYEIRSGRIARQATHGFIEFIGPPPN